MLHANALRRLPAPAAGSRRPTFVTGLVLAAMIGLLYAADWALRTENIPVRSVRFEGPFQHVTHGELEAIVMDQVRTNFFLVDLEAIKHRVEALPWVQRASVRRAWPWDVHVQFSEQHLVARWGAEAWLNDAGEIVRVTPPPTMPALVQLHGPGDSAPAVLAQYEQLRAPLERVGLAVARLEMTPRHSLELTLASGTVIHVDRVQAREKIERFVRVQREVLGRATTPPRRVDLRYSNGFAVQWGARRPASTPSAQEPGGSAVEQTAHEANKG